MRMTENSDEITELDGDTWLDGLDDREQTFVQNYLKTLNVKQSALDAGYSLSVAMTWAYYWASGKQPANEQVSEGKHKPHVYRAIRYGLDLLKKETIVTTDMVIRRLSAIAMADPRRAMKWGTKEGEVMRRNTVTLNSSDEIDDDTAAAIKEIKQNADGTISLKFHDSNQALAHLGKYLGIMDERVRHLGADGGPVQLVTTEMTAKEAAEAFKRTLEGD